MKIFITGNPGIGKTVVIKKVADLLKDKIIGFWTEEQRDSQTGKRVGFKIITTDGNISTLASKTLYSPFRIGSYGVNVKEFEALVIPLLEKAIEQRDKIIIIDEIGKMELFSEKFIKLVKQIIFTDNFNVIASIPSKDVHPLVSSIRKLKEGNLIEITTGNRDDMPAYIFKLFNFEKKRVYK